ncbi:hypothetical protein FQR65_LT09992 [Abscondita terminalis]|nr:hypothetical protein FQR65_LT09992 [Abscondita terminalis]
MAFNNEDHLNGQKRKLEIDLHLGIDSSTSTTEADQTPTPTRFIRNCEEVGLFQDLQNVNPFEETFRQATELAKNGSLHIPEASSDDSLHTPHIFPHIEELANGNDNSDCHYKITEEKKCKTPQIIVDHSKTSTVNNNDEGAVKLKLKEALTIRNKPDRKVDHVKRKPTLENTEKKVKLSRIINKDNDKNNLLKRSCLEIKREINRNAQSRSRERKKHHYRQLGEEVVHLRSVVTHLSKENQKLKDEVTWLKTILLYHKDCPVSQDPKVAEEITLLRKLSEDTIKNPIKPSSPPAKQIVNILPHPQTFIALPSVILQVPSAQTSSSILTSYGRVVPNSEFTTTTVPPKVVNASTTKKYSTQEVLSDVRVDCNSNEIVVSLDTNSGIFTGMIYPRGLSKNSTCMGEWIQQSSPVKYSLPLRGCNTMSTELDDGGIEYFNTIVVQPHLKLVTNQGRGFHVRCKYNTRNNISIINDDPRADPLSSDESPALEPMPGCTMKIFSGDPSEKEVAESVKIGDPLTLVIKIDAQDTYGLRITDCLVRDGLGWGEQRLINNEGCPVDNEIMGMFEYSSDKTKASVHFQAHKFPYTASVYYQCNVKLCLKTDNGCATTTPPKCGANRLRRQADSNEGTPATIEVYSGLYVNEANDLAKAGVEEDSVYSEKTSEDNICISQKTFAIGICIAGIILMLAVIAAILCILASRRHKKTTSNTGSSIYSGPYTNTAYSHTS